MIKCFKKLSTLGIITWLFCLYFKLEGISILSHDDSYNVKISCSLSFYFIVWIFCLQFLSMKLATVNTRVDFSIESLISKDVSLMALDNGFAF